MKERGMIFNGEMVLAILDGRKTQTRRIVKGTDGAVKFCKEWDINGEEIFVVLDEKDHTGMNPVLGAISCPFGGVGDRIWVRETWARYNIDQNSHDIAYRATTPEDWPEEGRWRPSIHMPRWASRILLEITDVRVERLNAISEEDARAEGIIDGGCLNCGEPEPCGCANPDPDATDAFAYLWQSIYGQESWNANPWVWVISFERIEGGEA
ncbi:morphogenetic protein [Klebsiella pneumoniae]|uniref:morphogenetic protein n=1 Tax=Klebsiella pneumoniae TaxID=573 RepID=UPI001CF61A80|nr:morphogenetic protein [Klebsiella pneumoniae]MCB3288058.1 morphogenetic protein [Klebsiella pneumoniae]MCQ3996598.1 morphogenetic protein [Klebsiella pneumoniae]HBR3967028.1 morphogenetic protein [Klebsiella pneumoniae]HBX7920671.1 morphogenetic protein [Klebsiella pneumoniae]